MISDLYECVVRWTPIKKVEDELDPKFAAIEGILSFGVMLPDDEEESFQEEHVQFSVVNSYLFGEGVFLLKDHEEIRKSIVGDVVVPASDNEMCLIAKYVLFHHNLMEPKEATVTVEVQQQRQDHDGAVITVQFKDNESQISDVTAFFLVHVKTKSTVEYGYPQVSGEVEIFPETYLEETICNLCRCFYPGIDM